MTASLRKHLGIRNAISILLTLASCFFYVAVAVASQRSLEVIALGATSTADEASKAREALAKGSAIIVMTDRTPDEFKSTFGSYIANSKAFKAKSNARLPDPAASESEPLTLRGVAAYVDASGITRSVQMFAAADDPGDGKNGWKQHLNDWIATEQTKALDAAADPEPPAQAWTLLYQTTIHAYGDEGSEQDTVELYRLNDINPESDYYMVYTSAQAFPDWHGECNGFDQCDAHTISRHFEHDAPIPGISLVDHSPTGTVGNGTVSFQIGASLSASGPGGSVSFSESWSQPDVVTTDNNNGSNAVWDENFSMHGIGSPCNPTNGNVPPPSSGAFLSHQGSIFRVPEGTSTLTFPIVANATFCDWRPKTPRIGPQYGTVSMLANLTVGAPVLSASPQSLTIPAGGTALLSVNALIPGSEQGFPWTINTPSWVTVPKNGYTQPAIIPIAVKPGTPDGTTDFIKIDSNPPFAAPSVENGAISIPVTVGNAAPDITAGVLLFGGLNGIDLQKTPMFYDLGSKQFSPINPPAAVRLGHTATVLNNGQVLIAGGGEPVAELFDPSTRSFSKTGTMANGRQNATATLLPDGKVLIVGGEDSNGPVGAAELYDPASGAFSPAGSLITPRKYHGATVVAHDRNGAFVLVYGGRDGNNHTLDDVEIWEESFLRFSPLGRMPEPVYNFPQPVAGSSTDAFHIVGGADDSVVGIPQEQLLNLDSLTFSPGDSLQTARAGSALAALGDGDLLVTGGGNSSGNLASAEIRTASGWHLVSGSSACPGAAGCMTTIRIGHTETTLPDGTVFIAGGKDGQSAPLGTTEFFDPKTNTFTAGPTGQPRSGHTASLVSTTSTTLTNNPPTSSFGQSVELVATVKTGLGTSQGSVQFLDGATVLGSVALQDGSATFATSALAQGSHTLTAKFLGGGGSRPSTSPAVKQQVGKTAATVTLSGSPNPSPLGGTVTLTASVAAGQQKPTGTVTFNDGSNPLGTQTIVNGEAQLMTSALSAGQHAITAVYSGDSSFDGGTSPLLTVYVNSTATQLSSTPNPSEKGQSVQLLATVQSPNGSPTGSVDFLDGATEIGTSPLTNGTARFATSTLAVGTHVLTAVYAGDSQFPRSASAALTQTVNGAAKAATSTTLTSNPNPSISGSSVSLTATVSGAAGATSTPTGSVAFMDQTTNTALGTAQLSTINGAEVAVLSTSALATAGTHILIAAYQGDTNFRASSSAPYTQTVSDRGKVTPTVDLTVNGSLGTTISVGDTATFVARIHAAPGYPWPTGSITISDSTNADNRYGAANIRKDPNSNDGLATITNAGIPAGSYTLIATYGGDNEGKYYNGAQSNTVSLGVKGSLGGPPPGPSLAIQATAGARNGRLLLISLTVTNNGKAPARDIALKQIALHTLDGRGEAELFAPTLPVNVGELQPGESSVVPLELQVPTTTRRLALREHGTFQDARGTVYQFSPAQVVSPRDRDTD